MILQPYQPTDYVQVIDKFASQNYLDKYLNKGLPWNVLSVVGLLHNEYMLLKNNGQIVAAGCVRYRRVGFRIEPWLYGITVRSDLRGKGLGKELMNQLLGYILLNMNGLWVEGGVKLTVDMDNTIALNLYIGLGFKKIGKNNNQYIMQYDYAQI